VLAFMPVRTTRLDHERLLDLGRERGLPEPPSRPRRGECCERGCEPCVWDYYEKGLTGWCERHGLERPEPAA